MSIEFIAFIDMDEEKTPVPQMMHVSTVGAGNGCEATIFFDICEYVETNVDRQLVTVARMGLYLDEFKAALALLEPEPETEPKGSES